MVKLSIVVPVYKAEKYLKNCIESILNQNSEEMELILVDDGSPDRCPDICDLYADRDDRVKVIHQINQGVVVARNTGIAVAKGEYLGFVDADDFIKPEMIQKAIQIIDSDQHYDIVVFDYYSFIKDKEEELSVHHQDINPDWPTEKLRDEFLYDNYPNFIWNKVYNKRLFENLEIPKGIWMEDLYMGARLFSRANKILFVPEAFYCYRIHSSTFSNAMKTKKKYGMFVAWREHERVCEEGGYAPLAYSRLRTIKAAISLKIINYSEEALNEEQLKELNKYLATIDEKLQGIKLPIKYRFELWADSRLPACIIKLLGSLSVYAEKRKQQRMK